jgi:hypothetical protein
MSELPTTPEQLKQRLTENFISRRATDEGFIHNPQADVTVMMKYMLEHVAAALHKQAWPEVFNKLAALRGVPVEQFVSEDCRLAHNAVYEFIRDTYYMRPDHETHMTFMETLDATGWRDVSYEGRMAYLYALGLFHLSRCWVIGRQSQTLGLPPACDFQDIAVAAGIEIRMFDQDIDPKQEAAAVVREAVKYALHLGLRKEDVDGIVSSVFLDPASSKTSPDLGTLGHLHAEASKHG